MDIIEKFKRNRFHVCRICGSDETSFKYDNRMKVDEWGFTVADELYGYYCAKCYEPTFGHNIDDFDSSFERFKGISTRSINLCYICDKLDTYGKVYSDTTKLYIMVCKRCMEDKLNDHYNSKCLIKPAKK